MKPVILLTAPRVTLPDGLTQVQLFQNYGDAIAQAGGLPMAATHADECAAAQLAAQCDGLYLTGGVDVTPICYGADRLPACGATDRGRDRLELLLGRAFLKERKPILGVCRGIELLNVLLGGDLYQDIPSQLGLPHPYHSVHPVRTVPGSILRGLFGEEFTVNSLHHQAVHRLGAGLIPIAHSENGAIVEALCHESLPLLATQWHPERMTGAHRWSPLGPDMGPLFAYFLSLCHK